MNGRYVPASSEQLAAIRLVGGVEVMRDGYLVAEPAYGTAVVKRFLSAARQHDKDLSLSIYKDAGFTREQQVLFEKYNKVVRSDRAGGGIPEVIQSVPGLTDAPLEDYDDLRLEKVTRVIDREKKKYQLHSIFSDESVTAKLALQPSVVQLAKRLSVTDAKEAARMLTRHLISRGYPNYLVVPGEFLRSRTHSQNVIHQMANLIEYSDNMIPAVVSHKEIKLTFKCFDTNVDMWTVVAPLKYAVEAQCVYQLAIKHGPEHLIFLLAAETQMLRIDIYDERARKYIDGTLRGYSSMEGVQAIEARLPEELTAEQKVRLTMSARKVVPVELDDGRVIGSAVRVTQRHAIVNAHTLDMARESDVVPMVAGKPVVDCSILGDDMVTFESLSQHPVQWPLRDPVLGEKVVLCYGVGNDEFEFSEVLRVLAISGSIMTLSVSKILRPGTSGAAVVSLTDNALLGMFVTGYQSVRASIFHSRYLMDMVDTDVKSVAPVDTPADAAGDETYGHMVRHGLRSYLDVVNTSIEPLYNGSEMCGTLVNYGNNWVTSSKVEGAVCADRTRIPWVESGCNSLRVAPSQVSSISVLPHVRPPRDRESACIFMRDVKGVVMSRIVSIVFDDGTDSKSYVMYGFPKTVHPMDYGVVVSSEDGAFLGHVCAREENEDSVAYKCVFPMNFESDSVEMTVDSFMTDSRVDEIVSGRYDQQGMTLLKRVGRSYMDVAVARDRRVVLVPDAVPSTGYYSLVLKRAVRTDLISKVQFAGIVSTYWAVLGLAVLSGYNSVVDDFVTDYLDALPDDDVSTPTRDKFRRSNSHG